MAVTAAAVLGPRVAAAPADGDPDAGREVYSANCAMCHGADATGMMGMHPALRGAVQRLGPEGVEVTVRNGRQTMPPMPAFADRLSDQEITNVVAYLDTLPPGARNFGPEMMGDGGMTGDGGMMERTLGGGWIGPLVAVLLALLLAVLILLAALLVNQRAKAPPAHAESPRELLDRRYAAGELSSEQYRQVREDLEG